MDKQENIVMPTLDEWRALYKVALEFKEIAPWEWMADSDVFGVKNPADGEIGYCCVLGALGEVFGLAVYLGREGLDGYLKVQEGAITVEDDDILHAKKCLLVTFEDRKDLGKPDLKIIKDLGLKFNGANAWPLFRSYEPGFYPWYLTKEQSRQLTLCLQQAKEISLRFKENPNLFASPDPEVSFARVSDDFTGNGMWKDIWLKPVPLRKAVIMSKAFDEQRLDTMLKKLPRQKQIWEMDYFYAPAYVAEKGKRPYFPLAFLLADSYSYFIFHAYVTTPAKYLLELHEQFLTAIEKAGVLAQEIKVTKEDLLVFCEPLASRLGIKMEIVNNLPALSDARKSMFEHFGRRNSAGISRTKSVEKA